MPSGSGSGSGSDHQPEMLEVEDVEQRQRRLQNILERLNEEGSSTVQSPNLSFDFGVGRTFATEPPAELLARVREFLPEIEQSNVELLQRDPRSIDIEHIEETDEHVVEMASPQNSDLGLGVFEQRSARRSHSISSSSSSKSSFSGSLGRVTSDSDSSSTQSESTSSSSSSSDSEDDSDTNSDGFTGSHRSRPIRPLPRRQGPMIEVLASED